MVRPCVAEVSSEARNFTGSSARTFGARPSARAAMTSDRRRANEFMTPSRIYCWVLCPAFSRCSPPASAPSRQLGRGGRIAACAAIAFDFEPASRTSCPDLIRASTPFLAAPEDVDGRVKPGHDGIVRNAISLLRLREGVIPTFREPASRAASTRRGAYASVSRMDSLLVYVILGAGAAGFTQGLSGFAFGLTAMAFWAWAVPPQLAAPMVVFGSLLGQMLAVGSLRPG